MDLMDYLVTNADAYVTLVEDGRHTFIAANKVGRQAVQDVINGQHPGKNPIIEWRDAGEAWPDTWLGFSFQTSQDKGLAAAASSNGARIVHEDNGTITVLHGGKPVFSGKR